MRLGARLVVCLFDRVTTWMNFICTNDALFCSVYSTSAESLVEKPVHYSGPVFALSWLTGVDCCSLVGPFGRRPYRQLVICFCFTGTRFVFCCEWDALGLIRTIWGVCLGVLH